MSKQRKILIITPTLSVSGGRERVLSNFSQHLNEKVDIKFLTLNGKSTSFYNIPENITIETISTFFLREDNIGSSKFQYLNDIKKLRRALIQNNDRKIIISTDVVITIFLFFAKFGLKRTIIANEHLPFTIQYSNSFWPKLRNYIYPKVVDILVALTHRDQVRYENLGCRHCVTIANALTYSNPVKSTLTSKTLLAVGRYTDQKGFDLLITACKPIFSKHNDWTLKILGEGPLHKDLSQQIALAGLSNNVFLCPPTKSIHEEYLKASGYILSSRYEAFPMVLIEAMSFGLPSIAFNCETGPAEIINNQIDGILIESEKVDKLSHAIMTLVENPELRANLSNNSYNNIKRLNPTIIFGKWLDLIESI